MTTSLHRENLVSNFIQTLEWKFWWSTSRAGFCNFSKWFCEFVWALVVFVPTRDCFYKQIGQLIWPFRVLFYSHGNWGVLHKLCSFLCYALTQPVHELLNYLNSRGQLFSQLYLILTQFNQMWACGIRQSKWWPSSEPHSAATQDGHATWQDCVCGNKSTCYQTYLGQTMPRDEIFTIVHLLLL